MRFFRKTILAILFMGMFCFSAAASQSLAVERQIYDYLTKELKLPSSSACGILANIEHESAFQLQIFGDNGTSFGLCQWHAGRFSNLKAYCRGRDLDYRTVDGQMAYLKFELETSYSSLYTLLLGMEDTPNGAYRAGYLWCTQFERPADMEEKGKQRATLAKGKYWNRYNSLFVMEQMDEPLTDEEVMQIVTQTEVTLPQPPEGSRVERWEGEETLALPIKPYIPRHRPQREQRRPNVSVGISTALLFAPLADVPRRRFQMEAPEEAPVFP